MTDLIAQLTIDAGGPGLKALAVRAKQLSAEALVRFQERGDGTIDAFVTTPFTVFVSRRIRGELREDGLVVGVDKAITAADEGVLVDAPRLASSWPGALPPSQGFVLLDTLPAQVVHDLAGKGQDLARQFSGPAGPPRSLLDQKVLDVTGPAGTASVSMRGIFACVSLGLLPGFADRPDVPHAVRVSTCGRWVRLDAPFGTVYESAGLNLLL
ncbi:hypothetical protein QVA66_11055 [Staphylococcus chromogenes]|nr:hypothetical protein [Staphylococcus chromogenes]